MLHLYSIVQLKYVTNINPVNILSDKGATNTRQLFIIFYKKYN